MLGFLCLYCLHKNFIRDYRVLTKATLGLEKGFWRKHFPNWVYANSKIYFFLFCSAKYYFHSQFFLELIQSSFLLQILHSLCYFLFPAFFPFVFMYRAAENRCTLRQYKSALSLHNRSWYVYLLLIFKV